MTTIAIVQSCYIPWKGYFDLIRRADNFILYDCVQYTDRDWRNRNRIKTSQGLQWLTIPVHSGRESRIAEVKCAGDEWRSLHWKTISHTYAKAPHFYRYAPMIEALYLGHENILSEVNHSFLKGLCTMMGIETPMHLLKEHLISEGDKTDKLIAVCRKYGATRYLSGPSAKIYLDVERFADAGIEVGWMRYDCYREYPQLHSSFDHNVSMLDMLFNVGPNWVNYM